MKKEVRPAGRVRISDEGYVEFVPEMAGYKSGPSERFKNSPEGRRIARFQRRCKAEARRQQLARVKAGKPASLPGPKPETREQKLDRLYGNIDVLTDCIPNLEKGSRGYRVMMRSLKNSVDAVKSLEAGQEVKPGRIPIEKQAIR